MEECEKGLRAEVTANYLRLTDAAVRAATLPSGKSQHYLHDTEQPGLAIRMRATGGRTWVYLFTKPGMRGTQRKTLGAWPKFNEKAARKAATFAAGEVVIGGVAPCIFRVWPGHESPLPRPQLVQQRVQAREMTLAQLSQRRHALARLDGTLGARFPAAAQVDIK